MKLRILCMPAIIESDFSYPERWKSCMDDIMMSRQLRSAWGEILDAAFTLCAADLTTTFV